MKSFISLCLLVSSFAFASSAEAPERIEREAYAAWLESIQSVVSPFRDHLFDWFEGDHERALPPEVFQDPEKLFVTVDRPLQETIELEEFGEIEAGVTYGFETYALIDAPVEMALETLLFKWGKPIGAREGVTYPMDTVYGFREEAMIEKWGAYQTTTIKTNGGLAKDQRDVYTLLVRGNARDGFVAIGNFLKPHGNTSTTSSMSIMSFRPTADGKTEFRVSARHMGQSYTFFGIEYGRRNFGFNRERVRVGQKEFIDSIYELQRTGKIRERRPR